ncbi:MAG: hypothetical protein J6H18_00040, partial [Lachnospiraceae bacterium]|nr:hypothetical protein [Lachnospiraceae bacterium]
IPHASVRFAQVILTPGILAGVFWCLLRTKSKGEKPAEKTGLSLRSLLLLPLHTASWYRL